MGCEETLYHGWGLRIHKWQSSTRATLNLMRICLHIYVPYICCYTSKVNIIICTTRYICIHMNTYDPLDTDFIQKFCEPCLSILTTVHESLSFQTECPKRWIAKESIHADVIVEEYKEGFVPTRTNSSCGSAIVPIVS